MPKLKQFKMFHLKGTLGLNQTWYTKKMVRDINSIGFIFQKFYPIEELMHILEILNNVLCHCMEVSSKTRILRQEGTS